jgi:peptide/nickel transport system permease protein
VTLGARDRALAGSLGVLATLALVAAFGNGLAGLAFGRGGAVAEWADGARGTLAAAAAVLTVAFLAGTLLGGIAALGPPLADTVLSRTMEISGALPSLVAVVVVRALAPVPELVAIGAVLAVLRTLGTAKVVRAGILSLVAEDFVLSARAAGSGRVRLFRKHLFPHLAGPALASAALAAATVIGLDAALSFLGLGTGGGSWGALLAEALERPAPLLGVGAALGAFSAVASLLVLADSIEARWMVGRRFV